MSRGICKADADGIVRMEEGSNVNSARHWWIIHDVCLLLPIYAPEAKVASGVVLVGAK